MLDIKTMIEAAKTCRNCLKHNIAPFLPPPIARVLFTYGIKHKIFPPIGRVYYFTIEFYRLDTVVVIGFF